MPSTVALLRGINVGGHNVVRMPELAACFHDAGYGDARTYIQSGNVVLTADPATGPELEDTLERTLEERFGRPVLVVVRSRDELAATVAAAPPGHGSAELRSDVFFVKHPLTPEELQTHLPELREGVDSVAPGPGALYFSRVAASAEASRLDVFLRRAVVRRTTVRNWRTTTRLLEMLDAE